VFFSVVAFYLLITFTLNGFINKQLMWYKIVCFDCFASIYLLASIMYCKLFMGDSYLFLLKQRMLYFLDSGVQLDFLCTWPSLFRSQ